MSVKPVRVTPQENYTLLIEFSNAEVRLFDVKPYISGSWFGQLADLTIFNAVKICGSTVEWEGGQDIAPHELYELSVPA